MWIAQDQLAARSAAAVAGREGAVADGAARVVLLGGEPAQQRAALLLKTMRDSNCQPAVVAAVSGKQLDDTLHSVAQRLR